jgi:hypothetical protein
MRIFQEEIFGPVLAVTTFKDEADALAIANDTIYGLGAGVWSRNGNVAYRMGRAIKAGRVWTNCYHAYPAHASFGGYKESGIGRETHKVILDHYQQLKCVLVSYSETMGAGDVYLGDIGGSPFYIGKAQYEYWKHTQLIIDVIEGTGGTFSLEGPEGKAFHTRSRVFNEAEMQELFGD